MPSARKIVVGLVAEGATDLVVIQSFLDAWIAAKRLALELEYVPLQPQLDATSGQYESGGWGLVKAWCAANSPDERERTVFASLFANEQPCDALVVHLDADRVREYVKGTRSKKRKKPKLKVKMTKADRLRVARQMLDLWLWPDGSKFAKRRIERKHVKCVPVRATEAWLLAAMNPRLDDPEEVDCEDEFLKIHPALETTIRGQRRLGKSTPKWKEFAIQTAPRVRSIAQKCYSLQLFLTEFESI